MEIYTPSKPIVKRQTSETDVALRRIRSIAIAEINACKELDKQKVLYSIKELIDGVLHEHSIFQDDDHHYR